MILRLATKKVAMGFLAQYTAHLLVTISIKIPIIGRSRSHRKITDNKIFKRMTQDKIRTTH